MKTLDQVAEEISHRLARIFLRGQDGRRPVNGANEQLQNDPHWKDLIQFYEYFHGDVGRGVGASHQTGWTGLVAKLLQPRKPDAIEVCGVHDTPVATDLRARAMARTN